MPIKDMMLAIFFLLLATAINAAPAAKRADDAATTTGYWLGQIQRQGTIPYGGSANYKIFRNVKDYGAVGDGSADDTAAINKAITDGGRCGQGCDSSTTTPAIIYFPAGTYKISAPLIMYYYSALIGDATAPPTILGDANFQGLALLDADPYIPNGNGAQWYTNQNQFFRQIRNFIIDMRQMPEGSDGNEPNGIHWQVAQATSLQNIVFQMRAATPTNRQRGLMIENGSGGFMSDLVFNGGNIGAFVGSQQFTTRNIVFNGCNTGILLIWDWLWTFKSLTFNNCGVGLNMASNNNGAQQVGSSVLMDSVFKNTPTGILTVFSKDSQPKTGGTLVIQNVDFTGAAKAITDTSGNTILAGGAEVISWVQGDVYLPSTGSRIVKRTPQSNNGYGTPTSSILSGSMTSSYPYANTTMPTSSSNGTFNPNATSCPTVAVPVASSRVQQGLTAPNIPSVLKDPTGAVFQRSKPQYETIPVSSFVSVKSRGAKGDGVTDDSAAIQSILNAATSDQIVYFDHGAYVITTTIQVPKNIRITGEIWPLIMISGSYFSDVNNPKPAFRVGQPGDVGSVEISDLVFETLGPAPGAIMMEWNVAQASQGSAAMWDTHFRVGGSAGTSLQQDQCLANVTESMTFRPECAGSFLMMHVTQQANAYLENTWFWLADHDLDADGHKQTTIFNGRGLLVQSQGPTWLYGTASEHSVFYNYQFVNAQNVFMGAIQTETAYFQSAPDALQGGFTPNSAFYDPDFSDCTGSDCKKTWGLRVVTSSDIYMFGGGLYSFFDNYKQDCLTTESCQLNMVDIQCSNKIYLYGLVTKAATNQVSVNGNPVVLQKDNTNGFGSTVALFQQN